MSVEAIRVRHGQVGALRLEAYGTTQAMGQAAAQAAAREMSRLGPTGGELAVVFATGASQLTTLDALTRIQGLPWRGMSGFHLDEYVGLEITHPASFRGYLRRELADKVPIKQFFEIDGTALDPDETCQRYAARLTAADPQLCLLGIGENGHLAFNDPGVADFDDPLAVKVADLDIVCRTQQAAEGWFPSLEDVPRQAITVTVPTIMKIPRLIIAVPGRRKAAIMRRVLEEPIGTACPATVLREHPAVTVYLDEESAAGLDDYLSAR